MPSFGERSKKALESAHPKLRALFEEVVKEYDCAVVCGFRNEQDQETAYVQGFSKVQFPNSKHNSYPSLAVDVIPWPTGYKDTEKMYHFAGYVLGISAMMKIPIRWGGDFNKDGNLKNDAFVDIPHFELKNEIP